MCHHTQHEQALRHRTSSYIDARGRTALYARLMQAMLGPKHASNLTNVIPHGKFQPCHWPHLAYVALHVLRCMLQEIALNAGSVVLEGTATRRGGVLSRGYRTPPRHPRCRAFGLSAYPGQTHGMLAHFMVRLYIAVVCKWQPTVLSYGEALADRIASYRIVSRYFVWYRIVSIVFSYGCIVPSLIVVHWWTQHPAQRAGFVWHVAINYGK